VREGDGNVRDGRRVGTADEEDCAAPDETERVLETEREDETGILGEAIVDPADVAADADGDDDEDEEDDGDDNNDDDDRGRGFVYEGSGGGTLITEGPESPGMV